MVDVFDVSFQFKVTHALQSDVDFYIQILLFAMFFE